MLDTVETPSAPVVYSNTVAVPPRDAAVWRTPMFEQYWRNREQVPVDTLLFYRMGDFYELFGADAVKAAPIMEVQLTARNKDAEVPVPMCGVPAFAVDSYAEKLLSQGIKVALCEQLSDPAAAKTKLVERGIIRILTPGLPVDPSRLNAQSPHYFVSIHASRVDGPADVCVFDFLGGELFTGEVAGSDELWELFARIDPKEVLASSELLKRGGYKVLDEGSRFSARITPWAGLSARKNLEEYLIYTQRVSDENLEKLLPEAKALHLISGAASDDRARLPMAVLEQWAVFPQLFDLLCGAGSALGARRTRELLATPLKNVERLKTRQKFFAALAEPKETLKICREVYDLERVLGRFRVGVAAPKELVQLTTSLRGARRVLQSLDHSQPLLKDFYRFEQLKPFADLERELAPLLEILERMLNVEIDVAKAQTLAELLKSGFDDALDALKSHLGDGETWLADFEAQLKAETQISSLKVRYNRVFGYFVEITKTHLAKVPARFERKQTTVGGERFTLPELRAKEHEILTASSRSEARAKELLEGLQKQILNQEGALKELFRQFAWVDALSGLKDRVQGLKRHGPWSEATIESGAFSFEIEDARHPVIETMTRDFIANSVTLGVGAKRLLLLTGPNMAGKSTFMRQTGLCLLLAQCGLPVPAKAMRFSPCSGFFSRMGASDKILEGESTFMVEMKESAQILKEADRDSFVLIDEIGRGTSTEDGLSIAQAVLEYLHETTQALCVFATHYHELSEIVEKLPRAINASMAIQEWKGELIFLRKLKFEAAESSYGIYVAKMAGLPRSLLTRAKTLFARHEESHATLAQESLGQGDLFSALEGPVVQNHAMVSNDRDVEIEELKQRMVRLEKVTAQLRSMDVDNVSPRDAWAALDNLVRESKNLEAQQH